MVKNNRYALKYRRRREGRTDYKKRLNLLKGRGARVVVRKTNAHTIVQFIEYLPDGDVVKAHADTKHLASKGWSASTSSIPAAYLAGYLAGVQAKKAGLSNAVLDMGRQQTSHGGRIFAAVKGVIDAGVDVPVSENALPSEERLVGEHISEGLKKEVEALKKKVNA